MKFSLSKFVVFIFAVVFLSQPSVALAARPGNCSDMYPGFSVQGSWPSSTSVDGNYSPISITFSGSGLQNSPSYKVSCAIDKFPSYRDQSIWNAETQSGGRISISANNNDCFRFTGTIFGNSSVNVPAYVKIEPINNPGGACTAIDYTISGTQSSVSCDRSNFSFTDGAGKSGCFQQGDQLNWSISNLLTTDGSPVTGTYYLKIDNTAMNASFNPIEISGGAASGTTRINSGTSTQKFSAHLYQYTSGSQSGYVSTCSSSQINIFASCSEDDKDNPADPPEDTPEFALCQQTADAGSIDVSSDYQQCLKCFGAGAGNEKAGDTKAPNAFWTAFGCVQTSKEGIVTSFLRIGMGLAGGFVLLSILYGAFILTTSSGEPKRVQEGQEMITSAVMGLLFVIFSIIILKFIGVSILQIPGFGGS